MKEIVALKPEMRSYFNNDYVNKKQKSQGIISLNKK